MIQKICWSFILLVLLTSCHKESVSIKGTVPAFMTFNNSELSNSTFFIGPELDSIDADVIADCDCCASNLAFVNDSSFLYEILCLGGNSYIKGRYVLSGDVLILETNKEVVSEEYELGTMNDDSPSTYELTLQEPRYLSYKVSELKGEQIIVHSKDDYTEYGIRDSDSALEYLRELRKEKVLRKYLKKI